MRTIANRQRGSIGHTRRQALGLGLGGVIGLSLGGCAKPTDSVNLYNWDTYIGETTLDDFTRETGTAVRMSYFSTNDELFAKMRAGNPGYDVIVPTNDFVDRMTRAGMLMPLDHALLPNLRNIAPRFLNGEYDRGNRHSVPYTWLVLGIGYRKSKVSGVPDSWRWVYDSDRYRGRIAMLSEAGELLRVALLYLGLDINSTNPADLARAEALLMRNRDNYLTFHDDNGQDLLLNGDVDLVMEYNGDIAQVMEEDDDIGFVVPREGSQLSVDCLSIPTGAPHPEAAHAFINYILDAKAGAEIAKTILYPTPNAAAAALMDPAYRENKVIFPPQDVLQRSHYTRFMGSKMASAYEYSFTRMRAG